MDHTENRQPRLITDTTEAKCARCGEIAYVETHVAETGADGAVSHYKAVAGSYRQATDSQGQPIGPVIPTCICTTKD